MNFNMMRKKMIFILKKKESDHTNKCNLLKTLSIIRSQIILNIYI